MTRYASVDDLRRFYRSDMSVDDDIYLQAIGAAELYIDTECKRRFDVAGSVATARSYVPSECSDTLWIHDCTEITSVAENSVTLVNNTDYYRYPLNGVSDDGETRPYYKLVRYLVPWYSHGQKPTVTVTAKWGWAATPEPIQYATLVLAKTYLEARDEKFGLAGVAGDGSIVRSAVPASVHQAIDHYRHRGVGMVR